MEPSDSLEKSTHYLLIQSAVLKSIYSYRRLSAVAVSNFYTQTSNLPSLPNNSNENGLRGK